MTAIRGIYEEIMTDLILKGFGGLVSKVDHDYKNGCTSLQQQHQPPYGTTYTDLKTKNARSPAGSFLLNGGASLPNSEVR